MLTICEELSLRGVGRAAWVKKERNSKDFFAESNIGKAVTYTLERINGLYEVIKNGLLDVSNNMAERTMRGHAMGRNNYLFCQTYFQFCRCLLWVYMSQF